MVLVVSLLITSLIGSIYIIFNLLRKVEKYEDEMKDTEQYMEILIKYFDMMTIHSNNAYKRMQDIDKLGSFESDDETGYVFKEIKQIITELEDVNLIFRSTTDDTRD